MIEKTDNIYPETGSERTKDKWESCFFIPLSLPREKVLGVPSAWCLKTVSLGGPSRRTLRGQEMGRGRVRLEELKGPNTHTRCTHAQKHMYKYPVIVHIHITCVFVHESVHEDVSEDLITHAIITSSIFKRRKCPSDQRRHKLDGMYTEGRPECLVSQHWGHDSHARTPRLRESWAEVV